MGGTELLFLLHVIDTDVKAAPVSKVIPMICSSIGLFAIGSITFGHDAVSGRILVPSPAARITAFIDSSFYDFMYLMV
jgi:hypothetical protein